ncbi:MAG: XrtA/PEP-CTERM system-associated ATPase [Acidobacteriota bacterium]
MYESFFNLDHKPFELVPNPSFLFMSQAHRKALNYLTYGIRQQSGFILLTGEVGTGKTTLIRRLINSQLTDVTLSKVFNTRVEAQQLLEMILEDFGVRPSGKDKPSLLRELNDFLITQYSRGRQCVLIIDEAQNLTHELLEEVRLLSNLENDYQKLLRIILVGQPELKQLLASPSLLQLRQRIQVSCHIPPLPAEEIEGYITHRLESAGNRQAVTFTPDAYEVVARYTRGVPRLINILCDYLLLDAFARESREVTVEAVHEVAGDLNFDNQYWNPPVEAETETLPEVTSHHPGRTTAKITSLLKNLNGRLKHIEDALPRLEHAPQPPAPDYSALQGQLAQFQESFQVRMNEMNHNVGHIADEVNSLKERLEVQDQQPPAFESKYLPPLAADVKNDAAVPTSKGWMKWLIFGKM